MNQADLIKGYVLEHAGPDRRAEASRRWYNALRRFILTDRSGGTGMKPDGIIYDSMLSKPGKHDTGCENATCTGR